MISILKKAIRQFPPSNYVLRGLQNIALPRPRVLAPNTSTPTPIVVAGMFNTANGLGEAARQAIRVLEDNNIPFIAVDLSAPFNQVDQVSTINLSEMVRTQSGTLLLYVNAPETKAALKHLGLKRWHNWRIIGCWAWELNVPPKEWLSITKHLSEIWACSEFVAGAFQPHVSIPIETVPISVSRPNHLEKNEPFIADGPLSVLIMADGKSSFYRKNITAAVEMFLTAFDDTDSATLTIKLRNARLFPAVMTDLENAIGPRKNIHIIDDSISNNERWQMMNDHDVVLSAHRAEGFGLHLAEAMALGRVVIATGWSGNMTFMNNENAILLPYTLTDATDPYGVYDPPEGAEWANVDTEAGIKALQMLADAPDRARKIGQRAEESIPHLLSADPLMKALRAPNHAPLVQK